MEDPSRSSLDLKKSKKKKEKKASKRPREEDNGEEAEAPEVSSILAPEQSFADGSLASLFDSSKSTAIAVEREEPKKHPEREDPEAKQERELDGKTEKKKFPKPTPEEEQERLERTIFVGGVPVSNKQEKKLIKYFSKYGEVESVRLRSIAFARNSNSKMRKIGYIKGTFNTNSEQCNAYVVYKEKASAEAALAENGKDDYEEGFHLRVDTAVTPTISHKKSVFVGNMPFSASEREVREAFLDCGPIEYVRLVRDKGTNLGRGYGYVCFEKRDGAKEAAARNGKIKVDGRVVRIERCKKEGDKKKEQGGKGRGSSAGRGRGGGGRGGGRDGGRGGGRGGGGRGGGRGRSSSGGRGRGRGGGGGFRPQRK